MSEPTELKPLTEAECNDPQRRRKHAVDELVHDMFMYAACLATVHELFRPGSPCERLCNQAVHDAEAVTAGLIMGLLDKWKHECDVTLPPETTPDHVWAAISGAEDPAEAAYWEFDAMVKGICGYTNLTERDAFKYLYRMALSRHDPGSKAV